MRKTFEFMAYVIFLVVLTTADTAAAGQLNGLAMPITKTVLFAETFETLTNTIKKGKIFMEKSNGYTNEIAAAPMDWPVLHPDSMPGLLGELVNEVCECTEADPATVLIPFLVRFAAHNNKPFFQMGYEQHRTAVNAAVVSDGLRSGYVIVDKILDDLFAGVGDAPKFMPGPIGSGKDLLSQILDEQLNKESDDDDFEPHQPKGGKRLLVHDKHFALTLERAKKKDSAISYTLKKLFDNYSAKLPIHSNENSVQATNAHVNILSYISRADITPLLPFFQGPADFADRFVWALVKRQQRQPLPTCMPEKRMKYFKKKVAELIKSARKLDEVTMTNTAKTLWAKEYPALTMELSGAAGSVLAYSEVHAIRHALNYSVIAGHKKSFIYSDDVIASLALMNFSRESALMLFNGCQRDIIQTKILGALLNAHNNAMSLTEISNDVFKHNLSSEDIGKALDSLEASKLLQISKNYTGGAPRTTVMLSPAQSA